ncbi:hypothetical protein, partial [Rivihabitans pingtungensis]|uniref:hypothetical protein n=1 Tax=Rivihabitans pingtungensis TaxID=1054498 RepID=UPI002BE07FB5
MDFVYKSLKYIFYFFLGLGLGFGCRAVSFYSVAGWFLNIFCVFGVCCAKFLARAVFIACGYFCRLSAWDFAGVANFASPDLHQAPGVGVLGYNPAFSLHCPPIMSDPRAIDSFGLYKRLFGYLKQYWRLF